MPSLFLFISPVNGDLHTLKSFLTGEAYDMDKQRKKVVLLKSAKRYDQTDNRQARVAEPSAPTLR